MLCITKKENQTQLYEESGELGNAKMEKMGGDVEERDWTKRQGEGCVRVIMLGSINPLQREMS